MTSMKLRGSLALVFCISAGLLLVAPGCGDDEDGGGGSGNKGNGGDGASGGAGSLCGNGFPDPDLGEECDDGNFDDTDACLSTCVAARCGDGFVQTGLEQCDDANLDDSDACLQTCQNASCGDGIIQVGVEQCDDGNEEEGDACSSTCTPGTGCGNGALEAGEECDDGNQSNADSCLNSCESAYCGDGYAEVGVEDCDDGNDVDDDTCTNACTINQLADFSCPGTELMLAANGEVSTTGDLTGLDDNYSGSCGGNGAPEVVYSVTPPADGTLDIAMGGQDASSDPVLYVRQSDCEGGTELGCSDSSFGGGTEQLVFPVTGGTTYYIFADGWQGTEGAYILTMNLLTTVPGDECPGNPLSINPGETIPISGNTSVAEASRVGLGACASSLTPEIIYQVTPNDNGTLYAALDPSYDASLYVRSNCNSQASQLACSEMAGSGGLELVQVPASAGSKYWFFVDGNAGDSGAYNIEFTLVGN